MRRWVLIAALLVAGCGSDKTPDLAAKKVSEAAVTTTATTTTTVATTRQVTTTTRVPFENYRQSLITAIEGIGDRVDTIEMVPDGNRDVLRINYSSSYSTNTFVMKVGWDIATKLADLWDGDESNGSTLNLDVTVYSSDRKTVLHYKCQGEIMDRVKARKITEPEWTAACRV